MKKYDRIFVSLGEAPVGCNHINAIDKEKILSTCIEQGYAAGTYCPDCEAYIEGGERLPLSNTHNYGDWLVITAATPDSEGMESRNCSLCGLSETRTLEKFPEREKFSESNISLIIGVSIAGICIVVSVGGIALAIKRNKRNRYKEL